MNCSNVKFRFSFNKNEALTYALFAGCLSAANSPTKDIGPFFYHDLSKKESYTFEKFEKKQYLVKEASQTCKWEKSTKTKEIKGYTCKMATCTFAKGKAFGNFDLPMTKATVWYTDEIKTNASPLMYNDLGGAILEMFVYFDDYSFTRISTDNITLNKTEKADLALAKSAEKIEQKAFLKKTK